MITEKDVKHIARLARIELSEQEEQKFGKELSSILEFIKKLEELDTDQVVPLAGGTALENVTREDEKIEAGLEERQEEMLAQAPGRKDRWIKVKSVFN